MTGEEEIWEKARNFFLSQGEGLASHPGEGGSRLRGRGGRPGVGSGPHCRALLTATSGRGANIVPLPHVRGRSAGL